MKENTRLYKDLSTLSKLLKIGPLILKKSAQKVRYHLPNPSHIQGHQMPNDENNFFRDSNVFPKHEIVKPMGPLGPPYVLILTSHIHQSHSLALVNQHFLVLYAIGLICKCGNHPTLFSGQNWDKFEDPKRIPPKMRWSPVFHHDHIFITLFLGSTKEKWMLFLRQFLFDGLVWLFFHRKVVEIN